MTTKKNHLETWIIYYRIKIQVYWCCWFINYYRIKLQVYCCCSFT